MPVSAADLVRENYRSQSGLWIARYVAGASKDPRIRVELEDFHRRLGVALMRVEQGRALKPKWTRCSKRDSAACPVCTEPGQRGHPAYLYAYVPKVGAKGGRWELVKESRDERARRLAVWLQGWLRERADAALLTLDTIQREAATADGPMGQDSEAGEAFAAWVRSGGVHS